MLGLPKWQGFVHNIWSSLQRDFTNRASSNLTSTIWHFLHMFFQAETAFILPCLLSAMTLLPVTLIATLGSSPPVPSFPALQSENHKSLTSTLMASASVGILQRGTPRLHICNQHVITESTCWHERTIGVQTLYVIVKQADIITTRYTLLYAEPRTYVLPHL
jgi:hypothetical protein